MKKCNVCLQVKAKSNFKSHKTSLDGLLTFCNQCVKDKAKQKSREPLGFVRAIYANQKNNSRSRGMPMPSYTSNQLYLWCINQPLFIKLFDAWVASGYKKNLRPSIDRLDDYKPYAKNNIQIVTWKENSDKSNKCEKQHKRIIRDDGIVFDSISKAANVHNGATSLLSRVCKNGGVAYGHTWRYYNEKD